ncbi:hypothetical protein BO79DRAFT_262138, partial [Aspergillus costaricaensis CBS 115574]
TCHSPEKESPLVTHKETAKFCCCHGTEASRLESSLRWCRLGGHSRVVPSMRDYSERFIWFPPVGRSRTRLALSHEQDGKSDICAKATRGASYDTCYNCSVMRETAKSNCGYNCYWMPAPTWRCLFPGTSQSATNETESIGNRDLIPALIQSNDPAMLSSTVSPILHVRDYL